jgi:hypothetical protein
MGASVSRLTQSQYFSPVFNTAVFDGPVRIYFAQKQESYALEVYFKISSRLRSMLGESLNRKSPCVFVMIHPNEDGFQESFPKEEKPFSFRRLDRDYVVGVNGYLGEQDMEDLIREVCRLCETAVSPKAVI